MKQTSKATSAPTTEEVAAKTSSCPVKDPGPQKKKTPKPEKKEPCRVKAPQKVQDESEEEIPLLVPIGETPTKENMEVCLLIFNIPSKLNQWQLCVSHCWVLVEEVQHRWEAVFVEFYMEGNLFHERFWNKRAKYQGKP